MAARASLCGMLPFTVFEELMLYEDSPAYPCNCFARFRFDGAIRREPFEIAARTAMGRHPLLSARVNLVRGRPHWQLRDEPESLVVWTDAAAQVYRRLAPIDLRAGPGLRFHVAVDAGRSECLIQFHHACCDGLGFFQFINDLLIAYAQATHETSPTAELPATEPKLLHRRGTFGLTTLKLLKMAPQQARGLLGVRQFLMRAPQPVIPHDRQPAEAASPDPHPAFHTHCFDLDTSKQIRAAARRLGVTTNDLLARDLFLALHQFRTRSGCASQREWLRLMIPINLRTGSHQGMPAANVVSSIFLDRRGMDMDDAVTLLTSIKDEMELIKRCQLGFTFIFSLYVRRLLAGGLRTTSHVMKCRTSAVFSNLGKLLEDSPLPRRDGKLICGNLCLEHIDIVAPINPFMCAGFVASWYADKLAITLAYDPRPLTATDAKDLLECFRHTIQETARVSARERLTKREVEAADVSF